MPRPRFLGSPLDQLDLRSAEQFNRTLPHQRFPVAGGGWFVFVHHDPEQRLKSVELVHGLIGHHRPSRFERRRGGLFVLAIQAPGVRRMEYGFRLTERDGNSQVVTDLLNPLTVAGPFGRMSVALAPGYASPLYARPPAAEARGGLDITTMPLFVDEGGHSRFGEAVIWRAAGSDATTPLPLLVVLDGLDYLHHAQLRRVLENLIEDGQCPPCRAVFLPPVDRSRQYSASPAMAGFLAEHLPRVLERVVPVPADAADRIGVGASLGALALLHGQCSPKPFFGRLLLQSGSYFQPQSDAMESRFSHFQLICHFVGEVLAGRVMPEPVPIHCGCGVGEENLENNLSMVEALRRGGCPVEFDQYPDAHNWIGWRDSIGAGLRWLLGEATDQPTTLKPTELE